MRANTVEQCLQALQEIGAAITDARDRRGLLDRIVSRIADALGADAGSIRLLDSTGEWLERAAASNVDEALLLHGARIRAGSLAGESVAAGTPLVVDLGQESRLAYHQELRRRGLATLVVTPLVIRGSVTGTLDLYFRSAERLDGDGMGWVKGFARAVAVAVDSMRVHEEATQRARENETLLSVAGIMSSTLDLAEVARRAVREMVRLSGADMGGAWVLTDDPHEFVALAGYHVPAEVRDRLRSMPLLVIHPLVGEVLDRKRSICSSHSQMDPLFDHPLLRLLPHKSVMAIPMRKDDDVIGVFVLLWTHEYHRFTEAEQRLLEGIGRAGAAAIDNARLVEAERSGFKAVEASEAKYRELVENVSDVVYSHGFDGRLVAMNAAAAQVTGYRVDELEGMPLARLIAPEYLPEVDQAIDAMAAGRTDGLSITLEILCKDGRRRVLECHSRAIVKDGVPTAVQGTAHDVTERAKLARRQAALTEITKDVAAAHDVDGLLALIGRRACELIGAAAAAVFVVEDDSIVLRSGHGLPLPARSRRWSVADSRLGATVRGRASRVT
jgi:PAS domain S-box-containing protein